MNRLLSFGRAGLGSGDAVKLLLGSVFLVFALLIGADAGIAAGQSKHIRVDGEGFAINRYDPVAYFTVGKPVRGQSDFVAEHNGAKYAFSSTENRALFLASPDKYEPQYGGYCAFGLVYGSKSDIDPEVWEIVDGRLYFMINPGTKSLWTKKKDTHIQIADKAWRSIVVPQ